jgi:HEAT repeat protein
MTSNASSRILELLELADDNPSPQDLTEFLSDPDPDVRRNALSVLSESTEDEDWKYASPHFVRAMLDADSSVRDAAIKFLRELVEVVVPGSEFNATLREAMASSDPAVRAAALEALWRHQLCSAAELLIFYGDDVEVVRVTAVLGFVSVDALDALDTASMDPATSVRLAAARGFGSVGDPRGASSLLKLSTDADDQVRAAALDSLAVVGCIGKSVDVAIAALSDESWRVRQGSANALGAADRAVAAPALINAARDENLDVRKAAIRSLAPWGIDRPEIEAALRTALDDPDADVRAYARMGLDSIASHPHTLGGESSHGTGS